jgi:flavin reductase (DIM6/NTAB) family NADH-FMN oxidoreductase RutF
MTFEGARSEPGGRLVLDPSEVPGGIYGVLNTLVVPRPIAWVSTRSSAGVDNLAPHSYFTVSSVRPPVVQFTSVGTKDSLRNITETGEFVVCACTGDLRVQVNVTGTPFPADLSEYDAAGLTREPSARVAPPRVGESPVALECVLAGTHSFGESTVVFGEVVYVAVAPHVLRDGVVAPDLLDPIARLGGADYTTLGRVFAQPRITYDDWRARQEAGT